MRHRVTTKKFGRDRDHRKALERNLLTALVLHEKIQTTQAKAKMLKKSFDKLVTRLTDIAPHNQVRVLKAELYGEASGKKMKDVLLPRLAVKNSGFTRTTKLYNRIGDDAPVVQIEIM